MLDRKINLVFVEFVSDLLFFSFRHYETDPEGGARELASFLTDQRGFVGVHPGDLYGILIEHFGQQDKFKQVFRFVQT